MIPSWKLPAGVDAALWDYASSTRLADEEDDYFADHPLIGTDLDRVAHRFQTPGSLVDLGCGTGRAALSFANRGFHPVVGVDLSGPMARAVMRKSEQLGLAVHALQANLCQLPLPDSVFDHALLLFSTLGMIRGRAARRWALGECSRVLRPGGRLALHAHNWWVNAHDPQGRLWMLSDLLARGLRRAHAGDRAATYRGIPGVSVHLFTLAELRADLRSAGFEIEEVVPLDAVTAEVISKPSWWPSIRAGGWLVFAQSNEVLGARGCRVASRSLPFKGAEVSGP